MEGQVGAGKRILILATSHDKLGNTNQATGCWWIFYTPHLLHSVYNCVCELSVYLATHHVLDATPVFSLLVRDMNSVQWIESCHIFCVCRAEELTAPYYIFKDAGAHVDVASIKGGKIPMGKRPCVVGILKVGQVMM